MCLRGEHGLRIIQPHAMETSWSRRSIHPPETYAVTPSQPIHNARIIQSVSTAVSRPAAVWLRQDIQKQGRTRQPQAGKQMFSDVKELRARTDGRKPLKGKDVCVLR